MTLSSKKNTFITLFILSRTSDNTTSQNIGETNAWAVPHLKLWGARPPSPPRFPPLRTAATQFASQAHRTISLWVSNLSKVARQRQVFSFQAGRSWPAE